MEYDTMLYLIEVLKRFVREAVLYSIRAHKQIFDHENIPAAVAYLQRASAKMAAAESLYYARHEELERGEAEEIFTLFDEFSDELIEDFATNHSQQWTDIQFNRLIEAVNASAFAFDNK